MTDPARLLVKQGRLWLSVCILAPIVAFVSVNPVLDMGFNDDWSYIQMARVFVDTGRFHYDGWTGPLAVPHILWGALVIKLFGFSYLALRVSMLAWWVTCGVLIYLLGCRIGLSRGYSALVSLSSTLCPLIVYTGSSFASDIPALTLMSLTAYLVMRAIAAAPTVGAMRWLAGAAFAGALSGMIREVYWFAAIWMIAAALFLRRDSRRLAILGVLLIAAILAGAFLSTRWHYAQPNALREAWAWHPISASDLAIIVGCCAELLLKTLLMSLPALACVMAGMLGTRAAIRPAIILTGVVIGAVASGEPHWLMAPWIGNLFTEFGGLPPNHDVIGDKPVILGGPIRVLLGLFVLAGLAIWIDASARTLGAARKTLISRFCSAATDPFLAFVVITAPFAAGYIGLLAFRSLFLMIYDRYLIPVIIIANLYTAGLAFRMLRDRVPIAAWVVLAGMGAFGIAIAHDGYSLNRARLAATTSLGDEGAQRHCITAGYEYDGWTQVTEQGTVPLLPAPLQSRPVDFWFFPKTPVVTPCYYVVLSPQPKLGPVDRKIGFSTWLPPRRREVLIQHAVQGCPASCANVANSQPGARTR